MFRLEPNCGCAFADRKVTSSTHFFPIRDHGEIHLHLTTLGREFVSYFSNLHRYGELKLTFPLCPLPHKDDCHTIKTLYIQTLQIGWCKCWLFIFLLSVCNCLILLVTLHFLQIIPQKHLLVVYISVVNFISIMSTCSFI